MTLHDVIEKLYEKLDPLALFARRFAMSIPALRIGRLGWELHTNRYDCRMLLLLAEQIEDRDRAVGVVAIARIKAQMAGDKEAADLLTELLGMKEAA